MSEDSKGPCWPCFICLSPVTIINDACSSQEALANQDQQLIGDYFCLKRIFSYLNLSKEFGKCPVDFVVLLCANCLNAASSLHKLCESWEVFQLKLNYHLKEFSGLIKVGENGGLENGIREKAKKECKL